MKNFYKIKIVYMSVLAILVIVAVFIAFEAIEKLNKEHNEFETLELTDLSVNGYSIDFTPDKKDYDIMLPQGNPQVPIVSASADRGINIEIYQANFQPGSVEACATVYLEKGSVNDKYEVKFKKNHQIGFVLQYDDRYTFVPDYELKDGEKLEYTIDGEVKNISVDSSGVITVIGVSDTPSVVNAVVNSQKVDTLTIDKTVKATVDVFIVAGQGNAAGEGGNIEECTNVFPGISYTIEHNDPLNSMTDLSKGRQGFTPALSEKWYSLTGRKSVFIQTAVSDVSVLQWTSEGEVFSIAKNRINSVFDFLGDEKSNYSVNKTFCLWLQGEWDIAHEMSFNDYKTYFTDFYKSIKNAANPQMTAIIPVRSSLNSEKDKNLIYPVVAAQYQLSNIYDDIMIATRIPENSTIENGYIKEGNLYYTQYGYNELGKDIAVNLHNIYDSSADRSPKSIDIFGNTYDTVFTNEDTAVIKNEEELRIVAITMPLYAKNGKISVEYDKDSLNYTDEGIIKISDKNTTYENSEVIFKAANVKVELNIQFKKTQSDNKNKSIAFVWEFDGLNTKDNNNLLTLSNRSAENGYVLEGGKIILNNRQADFLLEKTIKLTDEFDWSVEWKGSLTDNGILIGSDFSTKGYIYLAPFAQNMGYSVRMVDDDGQTFYLEYGDYADQNKTEQVWKINYSKDSKTISLYLNNNMIYKTVFEKAFVYTFSNVFGRYGSENVNYCYTGILDYLNVKIG